MSYILIGLTAITLVAWAGLLTVMVVRTRNPVIQPAPATGELGQESPAVVDLITGGWRLCDEAAAATVLDLAARGALEIEEVGPELSLVRLARGGPRERLTPYEQMVYDHLRTLAGSDGVVAAGALAEGNRDAGRWWNSFRRKVVREARSRGLSQPRWTTGQASLISGGALVPAAMAGITGLVWSAGESVQAAFFVGLATWAGLSALLKVFSGERGTPEGARVAGHWMGVREHLAAGGQFDEQPAAAVTIYGRHFAYAATLGLAHRAVTSLPISKEADDRRAWSDYGGLWRPVEVRYPGMPRGLKRRPLFWGRRPGFALLIVVLCALATGWFLFVPLIAVAVVRGGEFSFPGLLISAGLIAAGLYIVPLARVIIDFGRKGVVQGQVLRLRHYVHKRKNSTTHAYWIAVDDGRHDKVKAHMLSPAMFSSVSEGDTVRMSVGRGLGWVHDLTVLSRTDRRPAVHHETRQFAVRSGDADMPESLGDAAGGGRKGIAAALAGSLAVRAAGRARTRPAATLVTAADIKHALGADVGPPRPFQARLPFAVRGLDGWVHQGAGIAVEVLTAPDPALLNLGLPGGADSSVTGLGDEVRLGPGVVCVRSGGHSLAIAVVSPKWGPPPHERLLTLARAAAARMP